MRDGTWSGRRTKPAQRVETAAGCPGCGEEAAALLPIIYGPVLPRVVEQARRGELILGPLNHGRNEPRLACPRCGARFGAARPDLDRFGRALAGDDEGREHEQVGAARCIGQIARLALAEALQRRLASGDGRAAPARAALGWDGAIAEPAALAEALRAA
jgi:hypothetical protein